MIINSLNYILYFCKLFFMKESKIIKALNVLLNAFIVLYLSSFNFTLQQVEIKHHLYIFSANRS